MIRRLRAGSAEAEAWFDTRLHAMGEEELDQSVRATVTALLADIRSNKWEAVRSYSLKWDRAEPYEVAKKDLANAMDRISPELRNALQQAAERIRAYQQRLMPQSDMWENQDGGRVGCLVRPLEQVGLYVPGGAASYPSSVLMNAIPAKVAGVKEIIMVTPPTEHLNDAVLAAAYLAGVDRVFAVGGAQAVAALAYGAGPVPRVDKIVGPGNAYVAEAKRQLFGLIDIDMVAGPSEILVISDDKACPDAVAADMLSQAEHGALAGAPAGAFLVTTSERLADEVEERLCVRLNALPRREIAEDSLRRQGVIFLADTLEQACLIANRVAPEHLEILTENPDTLISAITNAGAIFVGPYSPEPLGDYWAGPSHVLPTSGTARFFSPLSVDSFLKKTSVIAYDKASLEAVWRDIALLAYAEGLDAHGAAVTMRYEV